MCKPKCNTCEYMERERKEFYEQHGECPYCFFGVPKDADENE